MQSLNRVIVKSKLLLSALIFLMLLSSCGKDNSMSVLEETSSVLLNISAVSSTNTGDFSIDIPLKTKGGKDFIIEKGGEFRLNSINVVNSGSKMNAASNGSIPEVRHFKIRSTQDGAYEDIPAGGMEITTKINDALYKIDVKLVSGELKLGETLDLSFSVKKRSDSNSIPLKRTVKLETSVSLQTDTSTKTTTTATTTATGNKTQSSTETKTVSNGISTSSSGSSTNTTNQQSGTGTPTGVNGSSTSVGIIAQNSDNIRQPIAS